MNGRVASRLRTVSALPNCQRCGGPGAFWRQWEEQGEEHFELLCPGCWSCVSDETLDPVVDTAGESLALAYRPTAGAS